MPMHASRGTKPRNTAASQVLGGAARGLGNILGQGATWLTGAMTQPVQTLKNAPQAFGSGFSGAMGTIGNSLGALGNYLSSQQPQGPPPVPRPQGQPQPGGPMFFPQQQQPQKADWGGQADFLRAMNEVRPQSFGEGLQGALDRMGGQLNRNANVVTQRAEMEAKLNAQERKGLRDDQFRNNFGGAMFGMQPERYVTGQERVQAPDKVGPNGAMPGGYMYQNTYGTRWTPMEGMQPGPAPPGPQGFGGNPAAATQDQAAQSLFGQVVGGAAPAAFGQGGGLQGATFNDPGGQFGGATLPTPPWAGGQPGSANMGIDTTGGQVWNPQLAEQASQRLGQVAQTVAPQMSGDPATQSAFQQQFGDYLAGAQGRAFNTLNRGGQKAEANQQLEGQITGSRLQNSLWQLMGQLYGSNLGTAGDKNQLALRMQRYLA